MKNISPLSTVWLRHLLDVHQQPLQILLWKNRQHNTPQTNKQTNNTVNQQHPGRIQTRQTKTRNFNIFETESEWNPDEAAVAAEGAPVWSSSPGPGCAATGGEGKLYGHLVDSEETTPISVSAKETKYFTGWPRTQPPKQEECLRLHDR